MYEPDADTLRLVRQLDYDVNGAANIASITDEEERAKAVAVFIKRRLVQGGKVRESPLQRKVRRNALEECLLALEVRADTCTCTDKAGKGAGSPRLCPACVRAHDAQRLWIDMEHLIIKRMQIQREYFSSLCAARAMSVSPAAAPAGRPALSPATVVKALEVTRQIEEEDNARHRAEKTA